jgi:signal transduction histidine kinase
MSAQESLAEIYKPWVTRISKSLARGEELRVDFEKLLDEFYNRMVQALNSGDPNWMDALLDTWASARTQTELEARASSLPVILNQIHLITFELAREKLSESDALALMEALLPIYLHAFEYSTRVEMDQNIAHISNKLEEANANLERLDKSKSDFIAVSAHELKTPLTLIEGYTTMLREIMAAKPDYSVTQIHLKGIDNGTRRLREIIDDLIDVSLIDINLLSLNFQPVWLNRLMDIIKGEFEQAVQERNLQFLLNLFPGSDEMIFGDSERLYQAFRNLISNAIKYTPDGGKVEVDGRKLPGFIEVIISDNGIGIDPENHALIFEKFGRLGNVSLHSSGKTKFKGGGPGLGLPITKGIVEAHGGSVWVESPGYNEVDCPGSTFHVLLPIRKTPPDSKSAKLFSPLIDMENIETSDYQVTG